MSKVLVGMSGGVDSTLTAYLLKEKGYEVVGVYLKLFDNDKKHNANIEKGKRVAEYLGIKHIVCDARDEFKDAVYNPFINSYQSGETPNPCGLCNRHIKFGRMLELAKEEGCDYLATGHYIKTDGQFLYEAADMTKDQTYFLFNVPKNVLPKLIFPMGERYKKDVKAYIEKIPPLTDIATQNESSEICFVDTTYRDILKLHTNVENPGDIVDNDGNIIGSHRGYMNYTIGQRRGFILTQPPEGPRYVTAIIAEKNQIKIGSKEDLEKLEVRIKDVNLFIPKEDFSATVKIRYGSEKIPCDVKFIGDIGYITLKKAAIGVASGQAAVFYDGSKMLGGGWII